MKEVFNTNRLFVETFASKYTLFLRRMIKFDIKLSDILLVQVLRQFFRVEILSSTLSFDIIEHKKNSNPP